MEMVYTSTHTVGEEAQVRDGVRIHNGPGPEQRPGQGEGGWSLCRGLIFSRVAVTFVPDITSWSSCSLEAGSGREKAVRG